MQAIKVILYIGVLITGLNACIEPFSPEIGGAGQYLVINGSITNEEGYHYVEISQASSYADRKYLPLNDCEVKVIDGLGNTFTMDNYTDGKYRTWIEKQYLQTGSRFKLEVILANGKKYESEFDSLLPCPEIDNIYYEETTIIPDDPSQKSETGLQFFIDYDATGDFADNYRWELIETWEYHSEEPIHIIYNGIDSSERLIKLNIRFLSFNNKEDQRIMDSLYTCWKTTMVRNIFIYTSNFKRDKKVTGLPLNIVTNKENRLTFKYSILVKQLSLGDIAFNFWNQLQQQSQESGGLYETQPYQLEGNIKCIDDEDEDEHVIGLFSVSSVNTKRFTTEIHMKPNDSYCADIVEGWEELQSYLWGGIIGHPPPDNNQLPSIPLFLHSFFDYAGDIRRDTFSLIDQSCIDCRLRGGTIIKPDFW